MKRLYKCHCLATNFTCSCRTELCEYLDWLSTIKRNTSMREIVFLTIASWHRRSLKTCEKNPLPNHTFTHALPSFFFPIVILDLNKKVHTAYCLFIYKRRAFTASYILSEIRACQLEPKLVTVNKTKR